MTKVRQTPAALFLFYGVLGVILLLNGAMTAVFGWRNLWPAFGDDSILPHVAGAAYALLIFDLAAAGYFMAFKRAAETSWQRFLTLGIAGVCLAGSIFATVEQLTYTAFGLAVLSGYADVIQLVALVLMISLTAVHSIMAAVYGLLSVAERARGRAITLKAGMIDDALDELETRVTADTGKIVDVMAADLRRDVLAALGFTPDLQKMIPAGTVAPVALDAAASTVGAGAANGHGGPTINPTTGGRP